MLVGRKKEKPKTQILLGAVKGGHRKGRGETYNVNLYNFLKCLKNKLIFKRKTLHHRY